MKTLAPEMVQFVRWIQINDAADDAASVRNACKKPGSGRCANEIDGLQQSTLAAGLQFGRFGEPPAAISELVAETRAAQQAAEDATKDYLDACPTADVGSADCKSKATELSSTVTQPLIDAYAKWKPYIKILVG